jgi:DtxR family Mn-dependent transcriptional regulator
MEHVIDDRLAQAVESVLNHPQTCPHGNPIPNSRGEIMDVESQPIPSLSTGDEGVIVKIVSERRDLLEYLLKLNLVPGTSLKVIEKAPFNGPITVETDTDRHALGRNVASIIWAKKEEKIS